MKFTALVLTTLMAITSFAASVQPSVDKLIAPSVQTQIIGRVVLDQGQTMACLATNCPPSMTYFQLVLDDAQIEGIGPVEMVVFQDFNKVMADQKPAAVVYGGVTLYEGMYIYVQADVRVARRGDKVYAVASNPVQIKLATVRHPVMLY